MYKYYYPKTLKGITLALLNMFNDMKVIKYDKDGGIVSEKRIPLTWGPMEKYHKDRKENHYFDKDGEENGIRYYPQIPRMAIVLAGIAYNPNRAAGVNQWRYWFQETLDISDSEIEQIVSDYQPTPYDYNFSLSIRTDSTDYLAQILDNILPYFNPSLYLRVKELDYLNVERDLKVTMDGVNPEFVGDMDETDTKYVNATINLTVEAFAYRPVVTSKLIKTINTKYFSLVESSITSAFGETSATNTFLEGFSVSGVQTSGGVVIETSAIPDSSVYYLSGHYDDDRGKEFDWFQQYRNTSAFGE